MPKPNVRIPEYRGVTTPMDFENEENGRLRDVLRYLEAKTGGEIGLEGSRIWPDDPSSARYWKLILRTPSGWKYSLIYRNLAGKEMTFMSPHLAAWLDLAKVAGGEIAFVPMRDWDWETCLRFPPGPGIGELVVSDMAGWTFTACGFAGKTYEECVLEMDLRLPDLKAREEEDSL